MWVSSARKLEMHRFIYGVGIGVIFFSLFNTFNIGHFLLDYIETAYADFNTVDPLSDGNSVDAAQDTCGTSVPDAECVNDGVATSSPPGTSGDFLTFSDGNVNSFVMNDFSGVDTVDTIIVPVYHQEGSSMAVYVSLWDATELTQYGSEVQLGNLTASGWGEATFGGLTLNQDQFNGMRVRLRCTRPGGGPKSTCTVYSMYAFINYTPAIDVTVSAAGTQQNLFVGTTSAHVGGVFSIAENTGSRNITDITITENGTVNAESNLNNIRLFYDLDQTDPYDCADQSYSGTETQFGLTDTNGFSGANGTSTFTHTGSGVPIAATSTLCIYPVLDVLSSATFGNTIQLEISDPSSEVEGTGSPFIEPATAVALSGTTTLLAERVSLEHYHWRDNAVETEAGAGSLTNGVEDTVYDAASTETTYRLRLAVSNEGNATSTAKQYRIEYVTKDEPCADETGWVDVGAVDGDDWDMADVGLVNDGDTTTDISTTTGGVTNPNNDFLTPNGGFRDTNSETGPITLSPTEFVELEYAMQASSSVSDGSTYCFRVTDQSTPLSQYSVYPEIIITADLTLSAVGTQLASINIPSTNQHVATFSITDSTAGAQTISSITITASGSVDLANDLFDIRLKYDLDVSNPYTCDDVSYDFTDTPFGVADTDGFSATSSAWFTGSVVASTTQTICLYVELSVDSDASDGELLDILLSSPTSDIVRSSGTIAPAAPVGVPGMTEFLKQNITQLHYHWRDNSGDEVNANSLTNGVEDTLLPELSKNSTTRLRFGVLNNGGATSTAHRYRLEWGQRLSTCSDIATWIDVDDPNDEFRMVTSLLTDGNDTTDIPIADGGVSNGGSDFLDINRAQKATTSLTADITLNPAQYVDIEYSIQATGTTTDGATYCFRLTDNGTELNTYSVYAEATIKPATDFFVTRGVSIIQSGSTTAFISEGSEYDLQFNDSSRAFVRITNAAMTGAGFANTGNNDADDVTARIANPSNIANNVVFQRVGSTNSTRIYWEVIEYIGAAGGENEIVVRQASTITYGTTATAATTSPITGILDDADVVPMITGQGSPSASRFNYNTVLSTSKWNAGASTTTFTRGEAGGDAVVVSYAVVEFTGNNWKIQRYEHNYTTAGALESETIPAQDAIGDISKAFLHVQKRVGTGLDTHANFGQRVELTNMVTIEFQLEGGASTPGHVAVAWVIENTQSTGEVMRVTRSDDTIPAGGTPPVIVNPDINATVDDRTIASINTVVSANGTTRSFQEPIIGATILNGSSTQYELWVGDTTDTLTFFTEVIEWPTASAKLYQNYYQWFVDNDTATPTDPWPAGATDLSENQEMTADFGPIASGESIRLRISLNAQAAALAPGIDAFLLQFAERPEGTSCSAVTANSWRPLGGIASTTALFRGHAGAPVDGSVLPSTILSVSDVAATYEEENNTAITPNVVLVDQDVEFDWNIENNGASDKTDYCFRMRYADGSKLEDYLNYPVLRTVGYEPEVGDWQWFNDENSLTPLDPIAGVNTTAPDVVNQDIVKLRVLVNELSGATGQDVKFKLQYSEDASFTSGVYDVVSTTTCTQNSLWCYADGAGIDNATITASVLPLASTCSGGVGAGCGTHNESTSTVTATVDHTALSRVEFEFTVLHAGARANAVYYFRLYDMVNDLALPASSTYPSLAPQGPQLVFSVSGLPAGTTTETFTTDVSTTPNSITFGSIPINTEYVAAHRLSVDTNASDGYQVVMYATQDLLNTYNESIAPITSTNAAPGEWGTSCSPSATGCFGYHVGDDALSSGSARFLLPDTFAAFSTTPEEVMYSSFASNDTEDMVYKIEVTDQQPAGEYTASVVFIATPSY